MLRWPLDWLGFPASRRQASTQAPGTGDGTVANDGGAINSVIVTNDNSNISFTINSTQAMASYIFFGVELQVTGQAANGDHLLNNNPYTAPNVGISTGVNSLIDTYGTGDDTYTYSGGWNHTGGSSYAAGGTGSTFATITVPLSSLGLSIGNSFLLNVISSYTNPVGQGAYGAWTARATRRRRIIPTIPGSGRTLMTPRPTPARPLTPERAFTP